MNLKKLLTNIYLQIAFGILVGIVLLILFVDKEGIISFFGLVGVVFIIINVIRLIDVLNRKRTDLKDLIIGYVIYPLALGSFIAINIAGFEQLTKTMNGYGIFKNFGILGFTFSVFIEVFRYQIFKKKIDFYLLILWLIVFPPTFISVASLINSFHADTTITTLKSVVLEKETEIDEEEKDDSQYLIYTKIGTHKKRLEVTPELWKELQKNDSVVLFLKDGNLGYQIVDRIEKGLNN